MWLMPHHEPKRLVLETFKATGRSQLTEVTVDNMMPVNSPSATFRDRVTNEPFLLHEDIIVKDKPLYSVMKPVIKYDPATEPPK